MHRGARECRHHYCRSSQGSVSINGHSYPNDMFCRIAGYELDLGCCLHIGLWCLPVSRYVPQQDVLEPCLTVLETMQFYVSLRSQSEVYFFFLSILLIFNCHRGLDIVV